MEERNNWTALNSLLRSMESENIQDYNFDGISELIKYESEKLHGDQSQVIRSISNLSMHMHKLDGMEENCFHPGKKKELKESLNLLLEAFKARDNYLKQSNLRKKTQNKLSAFEIALRHKFLEDFGILRNDMNGREVGELYSHLRNKKNIEIAYNDLINKSRSPKIRELQKVHDNLYDYPNIQEMIKKEMENK